MRAIFISLLGVCAAGIINAAQLTATDDRGTQIALPDRPARIVALAPSVTELLFAAGVIKVYDNVWFLRIEIRRRVIKGKVTVFTNTDQCYVYRVSRYYPVESFAFGSSVAFSVY